MECSPAECWSIFTSIGLHFRTDNSYDAFKYNFKGPRCNRDKFLVRRDRWKYEKLCKDYPKRDDYITYCLSNVLSGNLYIGSTKDEYYQKHKATLQRLDYTFSGDMSTLASNVGHFDAIISDGHIPTLYKSYQAGEVSLETLCILEHILNFTKDLPEDPLGSYQEALLVS